VRHSSESLAGRIGHFFLGGFVPDEIGEAHARRLWLRGGLPPAYLARSDEASAIWRENYISNFLERDIPLLGISIPARTLRRFWMMISLYHGQILNYSELGKSFGISDMTVRRYLDILSGTFMVRMLSPWIPNMGKRLVKSPKLYIRDSGLFHSLQSIESLSQLKSHPKLGASWEGFALEVVSRKLKLDEGKMFFWATHAGAELDLMWQAGGKNWGIEFKYGDAPKKTKSMDIAIEGLKLSRLWVIYPGDKRYDLDKKITVLPIADVGEISFCSTLPSLLSSR
jgi:predicted AAA+ superfamily ATPase